MFVFKLFILSKKQDLFLIVNKKVSAQNDKNLMHVDIFFRISKRILKKKGKFVQTYNTSLIRDIFLSFARPLAKTI